MGSQSRWRLSRTRCTCCRPGHAGEADPDHTRIHDRSSTSRTIRNASRRLGAREAGLDRTRIRARSSSNRNVCILSPCQFSFRRILYHYSDAFTLPSHWFFVQRYRGRIGFFSWVLCPSPHETRVTVLRGATLYSAAPYSGGSKNSFLLAMAVVLLMPVCS